MSVQIPRRPNNISPGDRVANVPADRGVGPAVSVTIGNSASGTATRLSLSPTARLADAFSVRQASQHSEAGLIRTHAVLETSYFALQGESRLYDRQA